jgi:hypothetical protein
VYAPAREPVEYGTREKQGDHEEQDDKWAFLPQRRRVRDNMCERRIQESADGNDWRGAAEAFNRYFPGAIELANLPGMPTGKEKKLTGNLHLQQLFHWTGGSLIPGPAQRQAQGADRRAGEGVPRENARQPGTRRRHSKGLGSMCPLSGLSQRIAARRIAPAGLFVWHAR